MKKLSTEIEYDSGLDHKELERFEDYYFSVNQFSCPKNEARMMSHYIESYWLWSACCEDKIKKG